jgi:hypothetical protein
MVTNATRSVDHGTWGASGEEIYQLIKEKKTHRKIALLDEIIRRPNDGNCKAGYRGG